MTIRSRIFLFNLISVLIATVVVALIGLKIVESTVIDGTYDRLTQIRIHKTTAIENYFRDLQVAINLISSHEYTNDILLDPRTDSHPSFRRRLDNYILDFNIYDMVLIDTKNRIIYSTRKDVEDGSSVQSAKHRFPKIAEVHRWGLSAQEGSSLYIDFDQDSVATDQQKTAVIASPIFKSGKYAGLLILKISISEIDRITSDNFAWATHGMGQTGETLVYGEDWSLRNMGRFRGAQHESTRGDEEI